MDKISRKTYIDCLWIVAAACFLICVLEGAIFFYNKFDSYFVYVIMLLQNAIKAYKLDADIKLDEAFAFAKEFNVYDIRAIISYVYCVVVVIAPLCTLAAIVNFLAKPFLFVKGAIKTAGKKKSLLIVGDEENKAKFIKAACTEKNRVYTYEKAPVSSEKSNEYLSNGIHMIKTFSGQKAEQKYSKSDIEDFDRVLLCYDNAMDSLEELKAIADYYLKKNPGKSVKNQKIYITCDELGIAEIIENYYDTEIQAQNAKEEIHIKIDLYISDVKKTAVDEMFKKYPIYSYNEKLFESQKGITNTTFDVHMGIIGFGDFGKKTLIEAMNLSVLDVNSKIVFDVFDKNLETIFPTFMKNFSTEMVHEIIKGQTSDDAYRTIVINDRKDSLFRCDGEMVIRFWAKDVDTILFTDTFKKINTEMPFTYIMVAMDTEKRMASSVAEMRRFIGTNWNTEDETPNPPIIVRMENNAEAFALIDGNKTVITYKESETVYSFDTIESSTIVENAKRFNFVYNCVSDQIYDFVSNFQETSGEKDVNKALYDAFIDGKFVPSFNEALKVISSGSSKEIQEKWLKNDFYSRDSSIAQSLHQQVKKWLYGTSEEVECSAISKAVRSDSKRNSKEYKGMLEHRRWNLYQISHGWAYTSASKKNKSLRLHPCLTTFDNLCKTKADTLEYDIIPYEMLALKDIEQ